MAGDVAVHGTKIAGSSGFSMEWCVEWQNVYGAASFDADISRFSMEWCVEWQNAKHGKLSVHDFAKPHLIHALHGKICAAMVTPGKAGDSPYLRKMVGMMPDGSGDVLGSAIYGGVKNRKAIRNSGRRAVIDPKSNAAPKGFNARADRLRFRDEHPRTFRNILRIRNNVKERLLEW